ncbi:uncharacterized protein YndB with AHSA1/START domain [Paenibacillus shirakamiensis]|uniref:Uncharacterized protein YndB with AHSA1/START domain n=1 Tax=Paenibacillus shirakamiensis TaxID=1265935 RepID=A0ABS4JBL7_9BACL|nr:SRPBCC domain-containing protein [Paenibacillus shirakamiensis]MBP1999102.1 uncharacterized protein YndB with AHSA1/START domain [Paenibacillus shirakamiensis]
MHPLKYQFYIATTQDKVWKALVEPEYVAQIYFGCIIQSTYEKGSALAYVGPGKDGDETVHVFGTLLDYEPGRLLQFTHQVGPSYLEQPDSFNPTSRITWEVEPAGSTTKLILTHDEWQAEDPNYERSDASWWFILSSLKSLLETGRPLEYSAE